jgi:hypothetical protein
MTRGVLEIVWETFIIVGILLLVTDSDLRRAAIGYYSVKELNLDISKFSVFT